MIQQIFGGLIILVDDLPVVQALQELKLNLLNQYGSYEAWYYVDYPISLRVMEIAHASMLNIFKDEGI